MRVPPTRRSRSVLSRPEVAVAALALTLVAHGALPGAAADAADVLAVTGRTNANVSLAADRTFAVAVWTAAASGGTTDIFAATSRDGGATFAAPVRVNSTPGEARVNGALIG